jgi:hypothetical protein
MARMMGATCRPFCPSCRSGKGCGPDCPDKSAPSVKAVRSREKRQGRRDILRLVGQRAAGAKIRF